jgi:hypothetical protein
MARTPGWWRNPTIVAVTREKEIRFISEAQEIKLGEQYYAPTQQTQGRREDVLP